MNMKDYRSSVEEIIKEINKDDVYGWKIANITKDHIDLRWDYDVNFRIEKPVDQDGFIWIKAICDYGYGLDSDKVETFYFATIGDTRYDDFHGSYDVAIPKFVKHVILNAKHVF